VTKPRRRDKESVAKSHRDQIAGNRISKPEFVPPQRSKQYADASASGSRRELSTAGAREAKRSLFWIPAQLMRLSA